MLLFLAILFLFSTVSSASDQPCDDVLSVDITDGETFENGTVFKDGVSYPPKLIYQKNISGKMKTFGCLCKIKNCFRKCCPVESYFNITQRSCVKDNEVQKDLMIQNGTDLYYLDSYKKTVDIRKQFALMYGKACPMMYVEDFKWYPQEDGQLYVDLPNNIPPWMLRGPDKYCIDTFVQEDPDTGETRTQLDALICFAEKQDDHHYIISSTCMLISCVFILATVAVYGWLPELRNLHGKVLMVYLMCLFVGFAFLGTMQLLLIVDNISPDTCIWFTILIYFALESAFFWLNVMSFDIWWTFSGKRGQSSKMSTRTRFVAYSVYAFGIPTLLTILLASLEFSGLPPHPLLPMLKHGGCFIHGTSKLIYLYGPIIILCIANMVFFVLTAWKIAQIKKQTSVLKSKESSMHDHHRNDKQRLLLYLKLFAVMGINWILEVISALYPQVDDFWKYTDAYNVLIGVIIFIIFVCKRKIFRLIKKRIKDKFHKPRSDIRELSDLRNRNFNLRQWQKQKQRVSQDTIRTTIYDGDSIMNGTTTH